jgi:hypothetical protein
MVVKFEKGFVFNWDDNNIKKTVENKALRGNSPQNPRKGSTAGSCVSAIVVHNILYIHNIELTFS